MSAVSDTPVRGRKRAMPEPAEITTYKSNCYVRSMILLEGRVQVEYASGKAIVADKFASLNFAVHTSPTRKTRQMFQPHPLPKAGEFPCEEFVKSTTLGPTANKVVALIANVHVPYYPNRAYILAGIGGFCKTHFPNMRPELSAVNVHYGYNNWRCDSVLVPAGNETNLQLEPK